MFEIAFVKWVLMVRARAAEKGRKALTPIRKLASQELYSNIQYILKENAAEIEKEKVALAICLQSCYSANFADGVKKMRFIAFLHIYLKTYSHA